MWPRVWTSALTAFTQILWNPWVCKFTANASVRPWPYINISTQNSKELSVYHSCSQANEPVSIIEDGICKTLSSKYNNKPLVWLPFLGVTCSNALFLSGFLWSVSKDWGTAESQVHVLKCKSCFKQAISQSTKQKQQIKATREVLASCLESAPLVNTRQIRMWSVTEIKELKSCIYIDQCYATFPNPIPFGKKKV